MHKKIKEQKKKNFNPKNVSNRKAFHTAARRWKKNTICSGLAFGIKTISP
jgi:hypothetical protein